MLAISDKTAPIVLGSWHQGEILEETARNRYHKGDRIVKKSGKTRLSRPLKLENLRLEIHPTFRKLLKVKSKNSSREGGGKKS